MKNKLKVIFKIFGSWTLKLVIGILKFVAAYSVLLLLFIGISFVADKFPNFTLALSIILTLMISIFIIDCVSYKFKMEYKQKLKELENNE